MIELIVSIVSQVTVILRDVLLFYKRGELEKDSTSLQSLGVVRVRVRAALIPTLTDTASVMGGVAGGGSGPGLWPKPSPGPVHALGGLDTLERMTKPQTHLPNAQKFVLVGTELNVAANLHVLHLTGGVLEPFWDSGEPRAGEKGAGAESRMHQAGAGRLGGHRPR